MHHRRDRGPVRPSKPARRRRRPRRTGNGDRANGRRNGRKRTATTLRTAAPTASWRAPAAARSTASRGDREPRNFEEFIYKVWGAGIAKHFAIPYNRKLWAVPLTEMETSWLGGRVPLPDLEEMIEGALQPVAQADGAERALRLSAARRLPGADGWLPARI